MDEQRWRALDERLRAVEAKLGLGDDAPLETPPAERDPDAFWVLSGLRDRLKDHPAGGITYAGSVTTPAGSAEWQYGLPTEALLTLQDATAEVAAGRLAALGHPVRLR